MAISKSLLYSTYLLIISLSSLPSFIISNPDRPSYDVDNSGDIHDILATYNIPKGIVPNAVKSFSLSEDGSFMVEMARPCYVKFSDDQIVYYGKTIKGKLSYGQISDVSGIQAKMFFIWLPVTGLDNDSGSGMVEFHVGALSKKLPAQQFETIPSCMNKQSSPSNGKSFLGQFYSFI